MILKDYREKATFCKIEKNCVCVHMCVACGENEAD